MTQLKSFIEKRSGHILFLAIILVLVGGLTYSISLGNAIRFPDEAEYYALAGNMVATHSYTHDGVHPTAYRAPAYPCMLALISWLGGSFFAFRMVNFVALALCCYTVYKILEASGARGAGAMAALIIAAYPLFPYTAGTLYPQIIGTLLFSSTILLLVRGDPTKRRVFLSGLLFGLLILTVPTFALLTPVLLAGPRILGRKRSFKLALILLFGITILISAWTLRNYLEFSRFVLITSNSGFNLLLGNSEVARTNFESVVDMSSYTNQAKQLDEISKDAFFGRKAVEWVTQNPFDAVKLYFQKVLNYFNYRNELYVASESTRTRDILVLLTYWPLLIVVLIRVALARLFSLSKVEVFLLVIYFGNALLSAIFFTRLRYRVPFDVLLISLAALSLWNLINVASEKRNRDLLSEKPAGE